jgi:hypothetical protein
MWSGFHHSSGEFKTAAKFWEEYTNKGIDPHKEHWVCCMKCQKGLSITAPHKRKIKGVERFIISFFKYQTNDGSVCVFAESPEHEKIKQFVGTLIQNKEVIMVVGHRKIPISEIDLSNVEYLRERIEQNRREGCINADHREADALAEFKLFHKELGQGIAFEVQLAAITELDKKKRTEDWISMGYSVCWIPEDIFDTEHGCLTTNEIPITHPYYLEFIKLMRNEFETTKKHINGQIEDFNIRVDKTTALLEGDIEEKFNEIKSRIESYEDMIKSRLDELERLEQTYKTKTERCSTCKHVGRERDQVTKQSTGNYCCWRKKNLGRGNIDYKNRPDIVDESFHCGFYEPQGGG